MRVARAASTVAFPAACTLIACSNPCPCGRRARSCRCDEAARERYRRRLSEPLLDRFDLRLALSPPDADRPRTGSARPTSAPASPPPSPRQEARYAGRRWGRNGVVPGGAVDAEIPLGPDAADALVAVARGGRVTGPRRWRRSAGSPAPWPTCATAARSRPTTCSGLRSAGGRPVTADRVAEAAVPTDELRGRRGPRRRAGTGARAPGRAAGPLAGSTRRRRRDPFGAGGRRAARPLEARRRPRRALAERARPGAAARVLAARGTRVLHVGADDFPCEPELDHGPAVLLAEGEGPRDAPAAPGGDRGVAGRHPARPARRRGPSVASSPSAGWPW